MRQLILKTDSSTDALLTRLQRELDVDSSAAVIKRALALANLAVSTAGLSLIWRIAGSDGREVAVRLDR